METQALEWEAILERLGRLEQANRRRRVVASASLLVMTLALLMGATAQRVPDEIRARAFVVVASDGRSQGRLGASAQRLSRSFRNARADGAQSRRSLSGV